MKKKEVLKNAFLGVLVVAILVLGYAWMHYWKVQLIEKPVEARSASILLDKFINDLQGRLDNKSSLLSCAKDPTCLIKEDRKTFSAEAEIESLSKEVKELEDKIQQLKKEKTALLAKKLP
ncbi:MAG: hypothetical protein NTY33_01960 [Candidatus Moranbacteria bacterium]|nr:hypothetical protein [Candidatus Moranbacteria bacterium]